MGMSEFFGPANNDQSLATLRRAVELGVSFLDTADMYGIGANERLLGEFLARGQRDNAIVATKFGAVRDPDTGVPIGLRGDAAYVRQACDASLRRLGIDHIDLYYLHHPDPKTPIEETVGAMAELVTAGKVRHLGLSNITAGQLRVGHGVHPIAAVQSEWSLFTRDVEESVVPACAELGVGFVPYSPLGRGFLTGVYTSTDGLAADDYRQAIPRFAAQNAEHNADLLKPIRQIAEAHGATTGQVAHAWLIQQSQARGLAVVPIPGTKHRTRLEENVDAVDIHLTDHDLAAVEPIAHHVAGDGRPALPPEVRRLLTNNT
jgi:aryl-alcohol dehydrogenase-like predicted oxidoreductase